ncbi:MAG: PAS domain S-box protein [Cyanobacteria bacterium J06638_28]
MSRLHTHCTFPHTADSQLSELCQTARSSCVMVVDKQNVIGILTERDVVRLNVQQQPLNVLTMQQVMSSPVVTLRESEFTDVNAAIHLLQKHRMRHLAILDDQECLVGLVTYESLQQAINTGQFNTELKVRQQTETRLQETEQRYAGLVATVPVGIFRDDAAGRCIYVNKQYCQITGYTPEASMGEGWQLGIHPEDRARVIAQWKQSVQTSVPFQTECRYQRPDGDCRWIYAQAVPEHNAAAQVIGYVGTLIDISDRKRTETALQKSEARWQFALEGLGDGVWDWHVRTNKVFYSQQWKAMLGYADPEIGEHFEDWERLVHPDDLAQCHANLRQYFSGESPEYQNEHRMRCRNGNYKWILTCGKVVEWTAEGQPQRMIGTHKDISERKQAEAALHNLMEGTAASTGHNFFPALVKHIAQALEVSHAVVSEYRDGVLQTLAFWAHDTLRPNFDYAPINTPCERALQDGQFCCSDAVQQHFPQLASLNLGAESYLGVALQSADGQVMGTFCILDSKPIQSPQRAEQIVRVFAARAAAELERQRALTALEETKQALEVKVEERVTELRTIVETIPDLLLHVRRDGTCLNYIQSPNSQGDFLPIQRNLSEVLPPDLLEQQLHRIEQAITTGITQVYEHQFEKQGHIVHEEIRIGAINSTEALIIVRDVTERKAIEADLEASRAYYQDIIADQTELICRYLPDGTLTFANDAYCSCFGQSSTELLGRSFAPLVLAEDRSLVIQHIENLSWDSPVATYEHQIMARDGRLLWLQWTNRCLFDPEGNFIEFQSVGRDITALKDAETHLLAVSDRLKLAVESAAIGIWDWDIFKNRLVWDERMYALYGITPDQFPNAYEAWLNGLHPEDREAAEALSEEARRGDCDYNTEFRVVHPDGSIHFIKANALIQRDSQGAAQRMIGTNYDITERKEAEAAMKRQLAAIEAATDSISILQGETFLYANQAKLDLFGYEHPKEILGKTWRSLYPPEEWKRCDREIFPALEREGAWQGEIIALRKDGSTFIEGMSLNITEDGLLICIGRDISDRKKAEQTLVQAKEAAEAAAQAKSNFLAMMSHEIRTPMNGVIGMVDLLLSTSLTAKQKEYTETIYRCGNSLLTIINDILDFSKIESGCLELEKYPFQLRDCLEKVLEIFAKTVSDKGLKLTCQIDPSCPNQLLGDEIRLRQILVNLVGNAVKFTEQGEVNVTVRCCAQNQKINRQSQIQLSFDIKDSGIGMPEDKLEQLFKAFNQADSSIARKYGGTGLGLAISKQLTELMGGKLSVTSEVGKGSCFSFSTIVELFAPIDDVVVGVNDSPINSKNILLAEQYPLKILIAEDNAINQKLMTTWLKNMGYQPDVVSNGLEVIDALKREPYDVILMDVHMPEMDGVTATQYIHQHWSVDQRPDIIAVTANAMRGDREQLLAAGMDDYISKPIQVEKLIAVLKKTTPLVSLQQTTQAVADSSAVTIPDDNWEEDLPLASFDDAEVLDRQKLIDMLSPLGGIQSEDMDLFRELFLVESDELARDIVRAIATQNFDQLQLKAHSLKSSSAALGATNLKELCLDLEIAGRQKVVVGAAKGKQLLFELRRFQQALQNL